MCSCESFRYAYQHSNLLVLQLDSWRLCRSPTPGWHALPPLQSLVLATRPLLVQKSWPGLALPSTLRLARPARPSSRPLPLPGPLRACTASSLWFNGPLYNLFHKFLVCDNQKFLGLTFTVATCPDVFFLKAVRFWSPENLKLKGEASAYLF